LNLDGPFKRLLHGFFLRELGLEADAPDGILTGTVHDFNLGRITEKLAAAVTPRIFGDGVAAFNNMCAGYGIGRVCALEGKEHGGRDALTELVAFFAQRFPLFVRLFPQYMDEKIYRPPESAHGRPPGRRLHDMGAGRLRRLPLRGV
jgi:hypothetical protein